EDKGTESGDTTTSVLPFLRIGKIKLSHVTAYYKSEPDGIEADADIGDFLLELPKVDLEQQEVAVGQMALTDSDIEVHLQESGEPAKQPTEKDEDAQKEENSELPWPDWAVTVASVNLSGNHILY